MSKDAKRPARPNDTDTKPVASTGADHERDLEDLLQHKLAPIDEHRQRTDSWMKEITSQVARLAGESEGDERRAGSIDKRIADLESRIQSLLTLTEVVSLDKNPFAERGGNPPTTPPIPTPQPHAAPQPDTAPAPSSATPAATPPPTKAAAPVPGAESGTEAAPEAAPEAVSDSPVEPTPTPPQASEPVPVDDDRIRNALSPDRRQQVAKALLEAPVPATEKPRPAPPAPRAGSHPNDASAEPAHNPFVDHEPATRADPAPAGVHGLPTRSSHDDTAPAAPLNETRRRLMILQWADLLSHELPKLDLGSFLGFYVETGWVDRALAACVRNLAWQLHQTAQRDNVSPTHTLPELHARSILMLSHLSNEPVPSAAARRIVEDAREVMEGAPILVEH